MLMPSRPLYCLGIGIRDRIDTGLKHNIRLCRLESFCLIGIRDRIDTGLKQVGKNCGFDEEVKLESETGLIRD